MRRKFRRCAGGVFEESAEVGDDVDPAFGLDFQAVEDGRKIVRDRAALVGADLSAGPIEKRKIFIELHREKFVIRRPSNIG